MRIVLAKLSYPGGITCFSLPVAASHSPAPLFPCSSPPRRPPFTHKPSTRRCRGPVTDGVGAAVAGARVTATNTATGSKREVTADAEGRYLLPNLQPGPYKLVVEAAGFSTKSFSNITLNVGEVQRLDAPLDVGSVAETVEVTAGDSLIPDRDLL